MDIAGNIFDLLEQYYFIDNYYLSGKYNNEDNSLPILCIYLTITFDNRLNAFAKEIFSRRRVIK